MQAPLRNIQGSAQLLNQRKLERRGRRSSSLSSLPSLSQQNNTENNITELLASMREKDYDPTRTTEEPLIPQDKNMNSVNNLDDLNQLDMPFCAIAQLSDESEDESDDGCDSEFPPSEYQVDINSGEGDKQVPIYDCLINEQESNISSMHTIQFLQTVRKSMRYT